MEHDVVNISSITHIESVDKLGQKTPMWRKYFGWYDIPPKFPHIRYDKLIPARVFPFFQKRIPLYCLSIGKMTVDNDMIRFKNKKPKSNFFFNYYNISTLPDFQIRISAIKILSRYPIRDIPCYKWIYIIYLKGDTFNDLLIYKGYKDRREARGKDMNHETDVLFEELRDKVVVKRNMLSKIIKVI